MELEDAIEYVEVFLEYEKWYAHSGNDEDFLRGIDKTAIEKILEHLKKQEKELEKKDKRILDLEFVLADMVLQFAGETKDEINTMGLSALETAFSELNFNNPMPIKQVHKRYKELAKQYYENKANEEE